MVGGRGASSDSSSVPPARQYTLPWHDSSEAPTDLTMTVQAVAAVERPHRHLPTRPAHPPPARRPPSRPPLPKLLGPTVV